MNAILPRRGRWPIGRRGLKPTALPFNPLTAEFILGPAIRPDPGAELPLRGSIEAAHATCGSTGTGAERLFDSRSRRISGATTSATTIMITKSST